MYTFDIFRNSVRASLSVLQAFIFSHSIDENRWYPFIDSLFDVFGDVFGDIILNKDDWLLKFTILNSFSVLKMITCFFKCPTFYVRFFKYLKILLFLPINKYSTISPIWFWKWENGALKIRKGTEIEMRHLKKCTWNHVKNISLTCFLGHFIIPPYDALEGYWPSTDRRRPVDRSLDYFHSRSPNYSS